MKHLHWDFAHLHFKPMSFKPMHFDPAEFGDNIKKFDAADITTFAILGGAVALILLMILSLFFNAPPVRSDLLIYPGV